MTPTTITLDQLAHTLTSSEKIFQQSITEKKLVPYKHILEANIPNIQKITKACRQTIEQGNQLNNVTFGLNNQLFHIQLYGQPQTFLKILDKHLYQLERLNHNLHDLEQESNQMIQIELINGFYLSNTKPFSCHQGLFLIPENERLYRGMILQETERDANIWQSKSIRPRTLSRIIRIFEDEMMDYFLVSGANEFPLIETTGYILSQKYHQWGKKTED